MGDLAIAVGASLGASLFVALIITPPLLALAAARKPGLRLPSIHAGYAYPLKGGLRSALLVVAVGIPAVLALTVCWGLTQPPAIFGGHWMWLLLAACGYGDHGAMARRNLAALVFALPIRCGNVLLVHIRWWVMLILFAPLWLFLFFSKFLVYRWSGNLFSVLNRLLMAMGRGFQKIYPSCLKAVTNHPWLSILIFVAIGAASVFIGPRLDLRLMPETTSQRFVMDLQLSRGTDVEDSREWARDFLAALKEQYPQLRGVAIAGEDARFSATLDRREEHQIQVVLLRAEAAANPEIEAAWLAKVEQFALSSGALSAAMWLPPLFHPGRHRQQRLSFALRSDDHAELKRIGSHLAKHPALARRPRRSLLRQ